MNPDLLFVAWAGTTAPAMWRALEQQGTIRGTTVATGLAERATWGSYVPGLNFLSHYVAEAPKNKVNNWLKIEDEADEPGAGHLHAGRVRDRADDRRAVAAEAATTSSGWSARSRASSSLAPKGVQRIRQSDHAMLQPMFQVRTRQVNGKWRAVPVKTFPAGEHGTRDRGSSRKRVA